MWSEIFLRLEEFRGVGILFFIILGWGWFFWYLEIYCIVMRGGFYFLYVCSLFFVEFLDLYMRLLNGC